MHGLMYIKFTISIFTYLLVIMIIIIILGDDMFRPLSLP